MPVTSETPRGGEWSALLPAQRAQGSRQPPWEHSHPAPAKPQTGVPVCESQCEACTSVMLITTPTPTLRHTCTYHTFTRSAHCCTRPNPQAGEADGGPRGRGTGYAPPEHPICPELTPQVCILPQKQRFAASFWSLEQDRGEDPSQPGHTPNQAARPSREQTRGAALPQSTPAARQHSPHHRTLRAVCTGS